MENELTKKYGFSQEQVDLIKSLVAPKASDLELELFLYHCNKVELDPLARQIYPVWRKQGDEEKMTIQVSIDGLRVVAERHGDYAGQDKVIFGENQILKYRAKEWNNGRQEWKDFQKEVPSYAEVIVYKWRGTQRFQMAVGIAYWDEYYPQTANTMWHKMPHTMIAKCAEALALRKAFPQDLSGLYSVDEMEQSEEVGLDNKAFIPEIIATDGYVNNGHAQSNSEVVTKTEKKKFNKLNF